MTQGVNLSLTSLETKKQLVSSGRFTQNQVVDLHSSTTRDPPQHFQKTDLSLYSNPELETYGKIQTRPLLDSLSSNMTNSEQKQERTKYLLRLNELKDLSTQYQEIILHCNNGRTRTPLLAALYIALTERKTFLDVLKNQIIEAYKAQRPGLSKMMGVDIEELRTKSDEWIRQNAKLVDLAEQVHKDLQKAEVEMQTMNETPVEAPENIYEPIAMRTRSQLNLTGMSMKRLLESL